MTDIIITTQIAIRRPSLLRLQLPKLHIGRAISEISSAIVQAFEMAYVAPFSAMQPKHSNVIDAASKAGILTGEFPSPISLK